MKKIYRLFTLFCMCGLFACSNEEIIIDSNSKIGYLKLNLSTNTTVVSKSKPAEGYNPKQLYVEILDADGNVAKEWDGTSFNGEEAKTNDHTLWTVDKRFQLKPGTYTINAYSYGFDGQYIDFDIPFYAGSATAIVKSGDTPTLANVECTLDNVKVTVNFDESVNNAFSYAAVRVRSEAAVPERSYLDFVMNNNDPSAYYPVGNLAAEITIVNKNNVSHTLEYPIEGPVVARNHYILNVKTANSGSGNINVQVDDETRTYTYTFNVSTIAKTYLIVNKPIVWSNFAILEGEVLSSESELDTSCMKMEYKTSTANEWTSVPTVSNGIYTATIKNMSPNTTYSYRMVYSKGEETYVSDERSFTTDAAPALYNGNMDAWYQDGKTWDAISEADFNAGNHFWDSSNPGTTTGAGVLINKNPTQGVTNPVHTAGGKAAELKSQYASAAGIGKFAAASLYVGEFGGLVGTNGAKINFGRPFTGRPTQLKGWFQYSTGAIDYAGNNQPSGTVSKGDTDLWSAYVVLTTGTYTLDNTDMAGTLKDFNALLNNPDDDFVVAYGALPDAQCIASNNWKEFTIDLTYKNLTAKPTHLIIVFSSSKYGDYFTGSTSSLLYLDDLEFVYGDSPRVVE
ncbi:MAG: PCMD domain-containing protein [Bacteroidales bacterium]|nr:PCMD domain-containing protein [Bacteroidales bacterium]